MRTFTSTAQRDGRWWVVQCDQEPGAISQVAQLSQAVDRQREAISMITDIPEDEIEVVLNPVVSDEGLALIAELKTVSAAVEKLQQSLGELRKRTIEELQSEGLSFRDIGVLLGVSHQRVAQLLERREVRADFQFLEDAGLTISVHADDVGPLVASPGLTWNLSGEQSVVVEADAGSKQVVEQR